MHIALAVALPKWSTAIQREKEEEAIFRGLQYAEAIRVFKARFGRYPTQLQELVELEPRSIRQLWTDPLSPDGTWTFGLLTEAQAGAGRSQRSRRNRGRGRAEDTDDDGETEETVRARGGRGAGKLIKVPPKPPEEDRVGTPKITSTGPIRGVYIHTDGEGVKVFQDTTTYSDWQFTEAEIPVPVVNDGFMPSVNSSVIGRPLVFQASALLPDEKDQVPRRGRERQRKRPRDGPKPRDL